MATVLGCIADDFTGATDLAGLLARSGMPVSLRLGVPEPQGSGADAVQKAPAPFEVIALKCRTAPVGQAVADCRAALAWLCQAGASRFYWKYCSTFDSTAEGNIGPVAEALMADIGTERTVYCPAFPENGRSVFMGNLFVGRQPLAESPMKDHPLTPMRDSNLMRLLAPQVARPVGLADRLTVALGPEMLAAALGELSDAGTAHIVVDAVADADLATLAAACRDWPLITGGSALAMPLPALYREAGLLEATRTDAASRPGPPGGALVLSGSCSAMTRAQVAAFAQTNPSYRLDPLALAKAGSEPAHAWLAAQPADTAPLVYATAEPEAVQAAQQALGAAQAGALVESTLAELAVAAVAGNRSRIVVAGGETSGAVAQALGVTRLDVGREIAPGVPWTFGESGGRPVALALKSGNFGKESFFTDALAALAWA
ncbi:MAG: 3-oxo-tetronate kinase [Pseudomonadota bacterium]